MPDAALLAGRLLERFGSLPGLLSTQPAAIRHCAGEQAAGVIEATRAAGLALLRTEIGAGVRIADTHQCVRYLRGLLAHCRREHLHVLHLDGEQCLIMDEEVATGTVNSLAFHPRQIIGRAMELGSAAIIIAHNHPSGNAAPSQADIAQSKRLAEAARLMGIELHDHLIFARRGWTSLKSEGIL